MTTVSSVGSSYHHGDLPNTLRRAAAEVIAERGVGGFSLREVARRAGVSHTAPAHHFGDVRGLMTALAEEGFELLYEATSAAAAEFDDPADKLAAIGSAYVEMARTHPAHVQVMFRTDIVDQECEAVTNRGLTAYGVVEGAVKAVLDAERLDADLDTATWMCWSMSQGLVQLEPKIVAINAAKGNAPVDATELVRRYVKLMLDGLRGSS